MPNELTEQRKLAAIVFTDMVSSMQLKQDLGDREALALIQRHHAVVRKILSEFSDGQEISTAGDSFFLVFGNPSDAVRFALLLQAQRFREPARVDYVFARRRDSTRTEQAFQESAEHLDALRWRNCGDDGLLILKWALNVRGATPPPA